jgi:hypothetical protein
MFLTQDSLRRSRPGARIKIGQFAKGHCSAAWSLFCLTQSPAIFTTVAALLVFGISTQAQTPRSVYPIQPPVDSTSSPQLSPDAQGSSRDEKTVATSLPDAPLPLGAVATSADREDSNVVGDSAGVSSSSNPMVSLPPFDPAIWTAVADSNFRSGVQPGGSKGYV